MGLIYAGRTGEILESCKPKLKSYKKKLDDYPVLPEGDIIFLLILISQYLYAKYYSFGTPNGNGYDVYPNTIYQALKNTGLGSFAKHVIELRNSVCHEYGTDRTNAELLELLDNMNKLRDLVYFIHKQYEQDDKPIKPKVLIVGNCKSKKTMATDEYLKVLVKETSNTTKISSVQNIIDMMEGK